MVKGSKPRGESKMFDVSPYQPPKSPKSEGSDGEIDEPLTQEQRYDQTKGTYTPMTARARRTKLHTGPLRLRHSKNPANRMQWWETDKQFHPYTPGVANPDNVAPPKAQKPPPPPKMWLPETSSEKDQKDRILAKAKAKAESEAKWQAAKKKAMEAEEQEEEEAERVEAERAEELKKKEKEAKGKKKEEANQKANVKDVKGLKKKGSQLTHAEKLKAAEEEERRKEEEAKRKEREEKEKQEQMAAMRKKWEEDAKNRKIPWDSEHHIKRSAANHEVQVYVREYFDRPLLKEGEGIPKVRELYSMNDRQMGWHDEPSAESGFRRTHLDWLGTPNVSGPKNQQLPSYWRKLVEKSHLNKSASSPGSITVGGETKTRTDQNFLHRLAQMPPHQSSEFWRKYAQEGKTTKTAVRRESTTAGGNPPPPPPPPAKDNTKTPDLYYVGGGSFLEGSHPPSGCMSDMPPIQEKAATVGARFFLDEPPLAKGERPEWDERWSVTHSKDNERMCKGHQQYFTSAQFLSGQEHGHPGAMLGLKEMRWRKVAKTVSNFPVGAEGKSSTGRFRLLV